MCWTGDPRALQAATQCTAVNWCVGFTAGGPLEMSLEAGFTATPANVSAAVSSLQEI